VEHPRFSLPLSPLALRMTTANESHSFLPSQPPAFYFLFHFLSPSLYIRQHLAAATWHQYALNTVLSPFLHFTHILLTFFLYIRHNDDLYTHSLTTPPFLATGLDRTRVLSRDFRCMYCKQLPRSSRMASCQSIRVFSFSRVRLRRLF